MNSLSSDSVRRHGVANFARVVSKLNLLKTKRTIFLQRHLTHLRLAAITAKFELHDGSSSCLDELSDFVELEDEAVLEELGKGGLVDKLGMAGDDEDAGHFTSNGVAAVLDSVVGNLDAVTLNKEASGPRDTEQLLGSFWGEEDYFGGSCLVSDVVGIVDIAAPNTADVTNPLEKLMNSHSRREIGEPKSAVFLWSEMLSAGVSLSVHAVVTSRKFRRVGSAGGELSGEGSRRSLLHYSLHRQEASGRDTNWHLSWKRSRGKLLERRGSRRRYAKDVDSKRLTSSRLRTGRAEKSVLKF